MHADHVDVSHYVLVCSVCGRRRPDDGVSLVCPEVHAPGLLRTEYHATSLVIDDQAIGVSRYRRWLPVRRALPGTGRTVVYRGERLGALLGVRNLWIAFNGYWPERGADLTTGSFKELEAATVLGRLPDGVGTLVLASAGNTAAAFAELCSRYGVPAVIVVPESALGHLRSCKPYGENVRVVAVTGAEYADAIALADALAELPGFIAEGGARNVGRRDGLGTVMLAAVEQLGGLPDVYVQAIGSGAGAVAAHEAAARIVRMRRSEGDTDRSPLPRMVLAQNSGFAPVHDAWHFGRLPGMAVAGDDPAVIRRAFAPELTSRRPLYEMCGGLRDALVESAGDVLVADAASAESAMDIFHELEGVDIEPPAGVALATLREALRAGRLDPESAILLNITGGGRARFARDHELELNPPDLVVPRSAAWSDESVAEIAAQVTPCRPRFPAL